LDSRVNTPLLQFLGITFSIFVGIQPRFIWPRKLNLAVSCRDKPGSSCGASTGKITSMKIALLILLGLVLAARRAALPASAPAGPRLCRNLQDQLF